MSGYALLPNLAGQKWPRKKRAPTADGCLYVVQLCPDLKPGRIKLGWALKPGNRMRHLVSCGHRTLRLIGLFESAPTPTDLDEREKKTWRLMEELGAQEHVWRACGGVVISSEWQPGPGQVADVPDPMAAVTVLQRFMSLYHEELRHATA